MSAQSEESPINPLEALDELVNGSRRPSERPEPRLAAVSGAPVTRVRTPDTYRPVAPGDLESAMSDFVRRQIKPEAVPEPAGLKREATRQMLKAAAMGLAAIVAVACVAALLFVTLFPKEKDAVQSFAAAAPAAAPPASDASTPASSQARGLVMPGGSSDGMTHEQSERLLQQFVEWRQKAALTDKP